MDHESLYNLAKQIDDAENAMFLHPHGKQVGGDHYRKKEIQPWTYMESIMSEAEFTGYLWGNVLKYMSRWQDKGGVQDLEKAQHYLLKLIQHAS